MKIKFKIKKNIITEFVPEIIVVLVFVLMCLMGSMFTLAKQKYDKLDKGLERITNTNYRVYDVDYD